MKFWHLFDILTNETKLMIVDDEDVIETSKTLIPHLIYDVYFNRDILSTYIEDNKLVIVLEQK